jgi:predicted DCC family thiol-disulfide oxidoreductase YuxK
LSQTGGPRPFAVVYDGNCSVCRRFVARLAEWDRENALEITPSGAPGIGNRFPWIPADAFAESVQVIRLSDGRTWQGAAALETLLDILPRGGTMSWLFRIPLVRPMIDRFYRWFARNRYRLGCEDHCKSD